MQDDLRMVKDRDGLENWKKKAIETTKNFKGNISSILRKDLVKYCTEGQKAFSPVHIPVELAMRLCSNVYAEFGQSSKNANTFGDKITGETGKLITKNRGGTSIKENIPVEQMIKEGDMRSGVYAYSGGKDSTAIVKKIPISERPTRHWGVDIKGKVIKENERDNSPNLEVAFEGVTEVILGKGGTPGYRGDCVWDSTENRIMVGFLGSRSGDAGLSEMREYAKGRGNPDWITDMGIRAMVPNQLTGDGRLADGFYGAYSKTRPALLSTMELMYHEWEKSGNLTPPSMCITGHSLGGGLATLMWSDVAKGKFSDDLKMKLLETGRDPQKVDAFILNMKKQAQLVAISSPPVGDQKFADSLKEESSRVCRLHYSDDKVVTGSEGILMKTNPVLGNPVEEMDISKVGLKNFFDGVQAYYIEGNIPLVHVPATIVDLGSASKSKWATKGFLQTGGLPHEMGNVQQGYNDLYQKRQDPQWGYVNNSAQIIQKKDLNNNSLQQMKLSESEQAEVSCIMDSTSALREALNVKNKYEPIIEKYEEIRGKIKSAVEDDNSTLYHEAMKDFNAIVQTCLNEKKYQPISGLLNTEYSMYQKSRLAGQRQHYEDRGIDPKYTDMEEQESNISVPTSVITTGGQVRKSMIELQESESTLKNNTSGITLKK